MNQEVIFSTGLDSQPNLAKILDAANVTEPALRTQVDAVLETVKKESQIILSRNGAKFDTPEAEAARKAMGRIDKAVILANKAILLHALAAAGVKIASVQYEGIGDSGGITKVQCAPALDGVHQAILLLRGRYRGLQSAFVELSLNHTDLNDALADFVDGDLISHFGHSGYENNEGGGGEAVFDVEKGTITLNHYDYIIERDESDHVL